MGGCGRWRWCGSGNEWWPLLSLAPLDWAGLVAAALHDRTPQFSILQPVYLQPPPHQRPQPFRFPLTSLSLPSCDKPQSFSRDFFTSKQSRKTNPHPVSVPLHQVSRPQSTTQRHSQPPFPKQTAPPAPDGIDLGWSRDECRLASLSSLRPPRLCSAHAPINPSCTATPCPMPHPSPDGSLLCLSARGGRLRWSAQRRLLGTPAWPTRATPPPSGEPPF